MVRSGLQQMMFPQATSHGNILTFTPPGFKQSLNVKFPDSRLAVCEKCKKNFKTRDMCRVRNTHTAAPWTTAYICLSLDESCTDENGKYIDQPLTVRMVQWQPFCVKEPFDPKTPVCAACKKTNRTRSFCRERHKHRQLPWCTVYVLLSALDAADPSTVVAAPSRRIDDTGIKQEPEEDKLREGEGKENTNQAIKEESSSPTNVGGGQDIESASAVESKPSEDGAASENASPEDSQEKPSSTNQGGEEGDNINDIADSRTFLAKVCSSSTTIHWLELAEFDASDATTMHGMVPADVSPYGMNPAVPAMPVQAVDPNHAQYYAHAYAAQQHQNALKSHQQYFFQMQQRHQHHYAAQQAAWQAQYSQQSQMQLAAQHQHPQAPPPPQHHPQQPPPHHPPPPPPPQQHHPQQQQGQQAPSATPSPMPGDSSSAPAPVTAGEAAAQQQKRNRQMAEDGSGQPQPPPEPQQQPLPAPGTAPHAPIQHPVQTQQQGQQQQGQQQQYMLYQQMYQAQLPPMTPQAPGYSSVGPRPPSQGQPQEGSSTMPVPVHAGMHSSMSVMMPNNDQQYQQAHIAEGNGKGNYEGDSKRQRLV